MCISKTSSEKFDFRTSRICKKITKILKTKLFFDTLFLFFETREIWKNGTFCWFLVFPHIKVTYEKISIFLCFFNRFWKSWTQISQNWSYLCTYIEIKFQKSTKNPIFLMIFGSEKSNLKKSLTGGTWNWLVWTHFWIPYDIWVLKIGVCTQEATLNVFQALRT